MQSRKISVFLLIGLVLTLCFSAFASNGNDKNKKQKRPKNTGIISVQTTPSALPVKIDGQVVGMSGVNEAAEFYLVPGIHLLEIEGPGGTKFVKEINVVKDVKNCICLDVVEKTTTRPCPYKMQINGPTSLTEGDLATFFVRNIAQVSEEDSNLNYVWRVTPSTARVTSGLGTDTITVDTSGLGGRDVSVEVDVGDGVYDANCRETKSISTNVERIPPPPKPIAYVCDEFATVAPDDDKVRFDNCVIELQNSPGAKIYMTISEGTDRASRARNTFERVEKRARDYFIRDKNVDPTQLEIVRGFDPVERTTTRVWIVPPGADLPN